MTETSLRALVKASALFAAFTLANACSCPSKPSEGSAERDATGATQALRTDVRKACEYQNAWPQRIHKTCTQCVSLSAAPACGCPADQREYSGKCYQDFLAKKNDESCKSVYECTNKCLRNQCDCIAKCYEGHDACMKLAANLEGCIAEVCDPHCR